MTKGLAPEANGRAEYMGYPADSFCRPSCACDPYRIRYTCPQEASSIGTHNDSVFYTMPRGSGYTDSPGIGEISVAGRDIAAMGILERIRQHAAVASGNFASMFKEVEIPPLPAATTRLIAELNKPEPDIGQVAKIISADLEVSAKVMKTINSSLYSLPSKVKSVQHAMTLLGLRSIQAIAFSYTMKATIPKPKGDLFDQEAFWTDSLLRALLARSLTRGSPAGGEDEAFTVMILADVALPVLLCVWRDYYTPIVEQWKTSTERLSQIEREDFGWDHAQAGAWILKSWSFSDEIVCLAGSHNLSISEIRQLGLEQTIALPLATASILPSVLRPSEERSRLLIRTACEAFSMTAKELGGLFSEVQSNFNDIREQFDLRDRNTSSMFESLISLSDSQLAEQSS